jgi:hypothetical protein
MGLVMKLLMGYLDWKNWEEERQMVDRGVGTEDQMTEVWSGGSGEASGSGSGSGSQMLADEDVQMGRAEVRVTEKGGEKEGAAGDKTAP